MDFAVLIQIAVQLSVAFTVFSFGLDSTPDDIRFMLHRRRLFARSLLSMYLVMPLFAVALTTVFEFHPSVEIALLALALSPVPPLLPRRLLRKGGGASYAFGLLFMAALLSIVLVPLGITIVAKVSDVPVHQATAAISGIVLQTVIIPYAGGTMVRRLAPAFAQSIAKPLSLAATVVLLAGVLFILGAFLPSIAALVGNGTLLVIAAFILVGLAAGHVLGGPDSDNRTVLALSTAVRHPGVAIAIAAGQGEKSAAAAVFVYLLVGLILSVPYLNRPRFQAAPRPR